MRVGVIGMGGFAGRHHDALLRLEAAGRARLLCTCDPEPASFAREAEAWRLRERGVRVFGDYRAMLEAEGRGLDMVVVPTPIHLHAEMHAAAVALGVPVYLEKPPTLDHAELERMIGVDAGAARAALVAFNFIIEKPRLALKRRLLAGEFGRVRRASLRSVIPRPTGYFNRNGWAGRLLVGGRVVLDSCFGNAMAHFVHNLLFWTGDESVFAWARPGTVQAELYRAHAIEGADTFFVTCVSDRGVPMEIAMTHALAEPVGNLETVVCERATLHYEAGARIEIRWRDGGVERIAPEGFDGVAENHLAYYRYLRGEAPRPATTLADSRPFVALNDLAYVSSRGITDFPGELLSRHAAGNAGQTFIRVRDMEAAMEAFLERGTWPSARWGGGGGEPVGREGLGRFHETLRVLREKSRAVAGESLSAALTR